LRCRSFGVSRAEAQGRYLYEFIDTANFDYVFETEQACWVKKSAIRSTGFITEQSIVNIRRHRIVIGIIRDITKEEKVSEKNIG
jgi:hypothetical protein